MPCRRLHLGAACNKAVAGVWLIWCWCRCRAVPCLAGWLVPCRAGVGVGVGVGGRYRWPAPAPDRKLVAVRFPGADRWSTPCLPDLVPVLCLAGWPVPCRCRYFALLCLADLVAVAVAVAGAVPGWCRAVLGCLVLVLGWLAGAGAGGGGGGQSQRQTSSPELVAVSVAGAALRCAVPCRAVLCLADLVAVASARPQAVPCWWPVLCLAG